MYIEVFRVDMTLYEALQYSSQNKNEGCGVREICETAKYSWFLRLGDGYRGFFVLSTFVYGQKPL